MNRYQKWRELADDLRRVRKEEMELRKEIADFVVGNTEMDNGTITVREVLDGFPCKATHSLSYSLDLAVLGNIWSALSPAEQAVVKMKPTLQKRPYKKLPEDSLIHEAVISKPASPKLEIGDYVGEAL